MIRAGLTRFQATGLPSAFSQQVGTQQYMLEQQGLSADGVVHSVMALAGARANLPGWTTNMRVSL
jgi:hypothetical protein